MISRRWLNFCCCCCCAVVVKKPIIEEHAFVPLAPFSLSNCSDHQELDSQEIKGIKKKERKTNKQTNKKKKTEFFHSFKFSQGKSFVLSLFSSFLSRSWQLSPPPPSVFVFSLQSFLFLFLFLLLFSLEK